MTSPSSCVCILGMHRSGTSAIARMLHEAGWYFGPDAELIAASPDNPSGHFELRFIMDVNENILATFGGSWHTPPALPEQWLQHSKVRAFHREASRYIARIRKGRARWAWKEPRACLTYPFWRQLLGPMRVLVCIRHPHDVAQSLQTRDRMAIQRGLDLWYRYNQQLVEHTQADQTLVTQYERYFDTPLEEYQRILQFVGCDPSQAQCAAAGRVVRPEHWHHRSATQLSSSPALPQQVRLLYAALSARASASLS